MADIIVVCERAKKNAEMREFKGDGDLIADFAVSPDIAGSLAAGDINFDGMAEIVLGGAEATKNNTFSIIDPRESTLITIPEFEKSYGVRVSVGDLGY